MKNLIRLTVEILERGTSQRARITAPGIARALEVAGDGKPGHQVRVLFPIDPEAFFVGNPSERELRAPGNRKVKKMTRTTLHKALRIPE
jgi:hypothetical protein